MFKWLQRPSPEDSLQDLNRHFLEMLEDGRHVFDAAANVVLGGGDPKRGA